MTEPIAEMIPIELWERIVYYTNAREDAFKGPPSDIVNICLVCSTLNRAINFHDNPSLYARIFRFKFDYHAPLRRFGRNRLNTRSMALELKKRIIVLKQVRRKECSTQDLWTCYLMMLENDGKNERQLIEWAHLYGYLKHETCLRFEANLNSTSNWFKNIEATSLLLWLWWLTFSRDDVRIENPHVRDSLVYPLLHNLIVASFRYPSFYGPESHLQVSSSEFWSSTPPTPVAHVNHFANKLRIATPLLSAGSLLVWTVRLETIRENVAFDRNFISSLPLDREAAIARRIVGPTQTNVLKFHAAQIQAPTHCPLALFTSFDDEILDDECRVYEKTSLVYGARRYDQDWYRSVACSDSLSISTPLNHNTYRPGALLGDWEGFFVQTSLEDHIVLLDDHDRIPSEPISLYRHPLYFTLREHHCFHPNVPIAPGNDCIGGQDVLNAWLPQGLTLKQCENEIEAFDPVANRNVRYQTFRPEGLVETKECLQSGKVPGSSRKSLGANENSTNNFPYIEKEWPNDILVTGKTSEEVGAAWGHYVFIGRVRLWDGLIILLRTPRDSTRSDLGRWLFRGYLHDHNLVGHWRETSTSPNRIGYQGGFVAHK
ncbi:hypothetical protein J3R30DRAFT_3470679 [Lentinula aciculospora]|uniref:F-box domain-containing protein n=1 Tax=Lentinula aciculospora TaxID=153920 RepID=A0A9W9DPS1_9AGAR|nr:hypothetical protein J3R30DRAFT_3470679 [Lentinula aciculospora]